MMRLLFPMLAFILMGTPSSLTAGSETSPPRSRIATTFPAGDGRLVLYRYHLNEVLETTYRRGNLYDGSGLQEIVDILRCRSDEKGHDIDLELIELLDHLQDHFGADAIEIISGYRSPALNRTLREGGAETSENSLHLKGKAADIHIDEVSEEAVAEYVRSLRVGGVGFYPALDFVHVDTGDVRNWDLPDKKGRLLTAMRKGVIWQITTDRDIYLPQEPIPYKILNITRTRKVLETAPMLHIFRRGLWTRLRPLAAPKDRAIDPGQAWEGQWHPLNTTSFGKYRIVIPGPARFPHLEARSNEFYRKKE